MSRYGSDLSDPALTRGQLAEAERAHVLEAFGADGSVTQVTALLGDGKEATVYACVTAPHTGVERAVAKVYRAERFRAFRGARD